MPPTQARDSRKWVADGFSAEDSVRIARCAEWAATFPLQKVKKRNRTEAICPMVGPSMKDQSLFFQASSLQDREPSDEMLDAVLREAADSFDSEIQASDPRLRCLVLILPGVRGARLLEATDPSRAIKNELLRRGILVGEFFPSCPLATTFNRRLFALRSPAPMYVLRTFIESDWRFICQVPKWRETYRDTFGDPPAHLRHLGGPIWRFRQKIAWRWDKVVNTISRTKDTTHESLPS
ncbi:MAG: hypothetical protein P1U85_06945 [Verrucomicrobiales bacterium]|nr:hypothetical protein [Verrucomicrobiales bacterium]